MATGHYTKARTEKLKEELKELEGMQEGREPAVEVGEEPTQSTEGNNEGSPSENPDVTAGQKEAKEDLTKNNGEAKEELQDLEYWKKRALEAEGRFNKSKPVYDRNIKELKDENLALQRDRVNQLKTINNLQQKLSVKQTNSIDSVFDKETTDILGEKTSSAIKETLKKQQETINQLTDQLRNQEVRTEEGKVETAAANEYNSFIGELTELVPDQAAMNADKAFVKWLSEPNARGKIRMDLLRSAERSRDAERVAQFFLDYKSETNKANASKDTIAARTGPSNQATDNTVSDNKPGEAREFKESEVDAFYKDVTKGVYKGRHDERLKLESEIEQAYIQGKIKIGI